MLIKKSAAHFEGPIYGQFNWVVLNSFLNSIHLTWSPQVNVNPEDLIPKLPKPKDLQPFPTTMSLVGQPLNLNFCV